MTEPPRVPPSLQTGHPWPLGVRHTPDGLNIAVFSEHGERVEWCWYDERGQTEWARLPLPGRTGDIWHGLLPDAPDRVVYGLRVWGPPPGPRLAHRFDPTRVLLDPWATRILYPGQLAIGAPDVAPLGVACRHDEQERIAFDATDRSPGHRLADSVLYEVHPAGFSLQHPGIDPAVRGTWLGLCDPAALQHFRTLGITTLSLLPVQAACDEVHLHRRGLHNYWGYNTLAFFTPSLRYSRSDPVAEFRQMVRTLHAEGLEVIIDVVYNHTAEGNEQGPTLSWRGLDNTHWYRMVPDQPHVNENWTGCGNTLNIAHPRVMQWVLDSLRHWVQHYHVDGFRFDLAATLGRTAAGHFDRHAAFFQALAQDPVLGRVKCIAEPWDIGPGGYQLGQFPPAWSQWNERFRRSVRGFWLQRTPSAADFARRLGGSPDLVQIPGQDALTQINYVTCHDGFTLLDLVSYERKHNEANGEDNRDGSADNQSWNCGVEGPTDLRTVQSVRDDLRRALLASLLLSRGVPMLLGGDEMGRTQGGNNNAYCQDNETSWFDWRQPDGELMQCVARLIALRRRHGALRRPRPLDLVADSQARWINRFGEPMGAADWQESRHVLLGLWLLPAHTDEVPLLILVNPEGRDGSFVLPAGTWTLVFDSSRADGSPDPASGIERAPTDAPATIPVPARSVRVLEGHTTPRSH